MTKLPLVYTGSKSDIVRNCGWPIHNPCVAPAPAGEGAIIGSAVHTYLEQTLSGVVLPDDHEGAAQGKGCVDLIEERRPLMQAHTQGNRTVLFYSEVTMSWDCLEWKGAIVGEHLNRAYPEAPPHVAFLTVDLAYVDQDGTLVVVDFKSDSDGTEFVEDHSQLMMCSLALASALGSKKVRAEIWGTRWYKRPWVEATEYTMLELYAVAQAIEDNMRNTQATAVPGAHCKWCPANGQCPATERALTGLAEMPSKWSSDIVSVEHAGWMIERLPLVKKALDNIERELKKFTDQVGEVPLSSGKVYKRSTYMKNSFNATAAKRFFEDRGELDQYMHQVEVTQYRQRKP